MPDEEKQPKFEQWCIVELMGHQTIAGLVREEVIAGHGFLRVDVPAVERGGEPVAAYTRWIAPGSVYAINPCSEAVARSAAASWRVAPPIPLDFKPERMLAQASRPQLDSDDPSDWHDGEGDS